MYANTNPNTNRKRDRTPIGKKHTLSQHLVLFNFVRNVHASSLITKPVLSDALKVTQLKLKDNASLHNKLIHT